MAKYKTLEKLAAAFKCGELQRSEYVLVGDKGGQSLRLQPLCATATECAEEQEYIRGKELFCQRDANPIEDLMKLAGIPFEWC